LEPVRQSGSGPAGPDEKFIRPDETGFLPNFLPDFCRIFAGLTSKMI
jgi:hypothetical protein